MSKIDEKKLLVSTSLLPVLADFLEDSGLRYTAKMKGNKVISAIRELDEWIMKNSKPDAVIQQDLIQRAFRQWVNKNFNRNGSN